MLCRHTGGAVSVVEATYESRKQPDLFPQVLVEIEGENGAIELEPDYRVRLTANGTVTTTSVEPEVLNWAERPWHVVQHSVLQTCAHILESYRAGQPAETSADDNMRTFALCEAAYRSAQTGTAVAPDEM